MKKRAEKKEEDRRKSWGENGNGRF